MKAGIDNITIAMPYYNCPMMLERQIEEWCQYPSDRVQIIVIDDGSSDLPASPVFKRSDLSNINILLYRIEPDIAWNWEGTRNLAFHIAEPGWVFSTDMDHVIPVDSIKRLLSMELNTACYYVPMRYEAVGKKGKVPMKRHTDTFIMTKDLYWKAGGMDEDFAGWYGLSTTMFRRQLNEISARWTLDEVYMVWYGKQIEDAQCSLGRQGSKYDALLNPVLVKKSKQKYNPKNPLRFDWQLVYGSKN